MTTMPKLNTAPVEFVDVGCAMCGAKPGRHCRSVAGREPHYTRRLDAYKARNRELVAAALEIEAVADGLGYSEPAGEGNPYMRADAAEIVSSVTAERDALVAAAELLTQQQNDSARAVDAAIAETLDAVAERMRARHLGFGPGALQLIAAGLGLEHYRTPAQRAAGYAVFDLVQPEPAGRPVAAAQWDGTPEGADRIILWVREHLEAQAQLIGVDEPHRLRYYAERNRLGGLDWAAFVLIHPHPTAGLWESKRVNPGDYIVPTSTGRIRIITAADFAAQYTPESENSNA